MSRPLIVLVGLVYASVSIEMGIKGHLGMSIMFAGYAIGNIGLWILAA